MPRVLRHDICIFYPNTFASCPLARPSNIARLQTEFGRRKHFAKKGRKALRNQGSARRLLFCLIVVSSVSAFDWLRAQG